MKRQRLLHGSLLGCLLIAFAAPGVAQVTGSFTTITSPAAGTGALQGTYVLGIDTAGDVAGNYVDSSGVSHGFVQLAGGTFVSFDVAGAGTIMGYGTFVTAMSPEGDVSGWYIAAVNTEFGTFPQRYGFIRAASGVVTTFTTDFGRTYQVFGINSSDTVTGENTLDVGGAFVRTSDGTVTSFFVPESNLSSNVGIGINASGVVVGRWLEVTNPTGAQGLLSHGFVRAIDGTITSFDPPNVSTTGAGHGNVGTTPFAIDTAGDIVGSYTDVSNARHSFLRSAGGTFTTFDPPGTDTGACPASGTGSVLCGSGALGMNDAGQIVGAYFDSDGVAHGYVRAASGSFTTFDIPSAGSGVDTGTAAFAINASGTVGGTYIDANSVMHGFVGTTAPAPTTSTIVASQGAIVFNQPASFSATISSSFGSPADGESVYFSNGMTQLGSSTLSKGVASFTTTALPVGTDSITASYNGDSDFAGSTSAGVTQTVGKATSFTTLTSSLSPSTSGESVTLTAAVTGQFGGTATGSVTFSNGSTSLGMAPLSGNSASLTTAALPSGSDSITASYGGDTNFGASTSNALSQVVMDFSIAAAPASFTVSAGSSGTTTVTVTPGNGFSSAISFACSSGLPAGASCSFSPATVTPPNTTSTTVTVSTSSPTASLRRGSGPLFPASALAALLCCLGFRKRQRLLMLLLVSVAGLCSLSACGSGGGGGSSSGPPPVVSTVTVTATSGTIQHTTTFMITVD
jgi:hypothetical protein